MGSIEVGAESTIDIGATISIAAITVDDGQTLNLDAVTVSGTSISVQSSRRRNTIFDCDYSSAVCSSDRATLDGLDVANHGTIKVSGAATLKNDLVTNDALDQ